MITKIFGKGIKGLEFEQPLGRLNLFIGPNGAGKSARSDALVLAIHGNIPGVAKKNDEILDTYGSGEKLFVGFERSDRTHFLRRFMRSGDKVSQDFMIDRKKTTRDGYMQALGNTRIFDLRAFLDMSDQKKIDLIFSLFPPDGDMGELDGKIDEAKSRRDRLQAQTRELEGTVKRLASERAAIELPSGTLAETSAQIEAIKQQLADAREALQNALVAREKEAAVATVPLPVVSDPIPIIEPLTTQHMITPYVNSAENVFDFSASEKAEMAIRSIIATMGRAGCDACAARLVALRELGRLKGAA